MIAKKVSDKEVSEPKQEKTTETKKENKKQQTNLPKVKKINQSGDPYENTVTVSDLDSIYILVNKYSGLPADYEPSDYIGFPTDPLIIEKSSQQKEQGSQPHHITS